MNWKVRRFLKSCKSKHPHRSRGAAEAHLRGLRRIGKADETLVAYPCPFADHWHVGHKKPAPGERASH